MPRVSWAYEESAVSDSSKVLSPAARAAAHQRQLDAGVVFGLRPRPRLSFHPRASKDQWHLKACFEEEPA